MRRRPVAATAAAKCRASDRPSHCGHEAPDGDAVTGEPGLMVRADGEVADDREGHAIGAMAKAVCGEILFDAVVRTMQVVGVNALDRSHPV
jgi:alkylation response protein AidB-like acyl-CoA dehydrogenase